MHPKIALTLLLPFFILTTLHAESASRKWTNASGVVIDAELVSYDGAIALLNKDGKEFRVPANTLSEEDRKWLTN